MQSANQDLIRLQQPKALPLSAFVRWYLGNLRQISQKTCQHPDIVKTRERVPTIKWARGSQEMPLR